MNGSPSSTGNWSKTSKRAGSVAMTFLLADASTSELQICTAGQYAPFRSRSTKLATLASARPAASRNFPAGKLSRHTGPLKPGEFWLLFSDGIAEARNPAGTELGTDGFLQALPQRSDGHQNAGRGDGSLASACGVGGPARRRFRVAPGLAGLAPAHEFRTTCSPENLCHGRAFIEQLGHLCRL